MSQAQKLRLLAEECRNAKSAAAHLRFSLERTQTLIPRLHENISLEDLEKLESLASRFARLADMLIQRLMRLVDEIELTPLGSLLDRIDRAEKRGWVADAQTLVRIRELRNLIAHEYAADRLADIYETAFILAPELDNAVQQAIHYSEDLLQRLS